MTIRLITFKVAVKINDTDLTEHHQLFDERQSIITKQLETNLIAHGFCPIRILGGLSLPATMITPLTKAEKKTAGISDNEM